VRRGKKRQQKGRGITQAWKMPQKFRHVRKPKQTRGLRANIYISSAIEKEECRQRKKRDRGENSPEKIDTEGGRLEESKVPLLRGTTPNPRIAPVRTCQGKNQTESSSLEKKNQGRARRLKPGFRHQTPKTA